MSNPRLVIGKVRDLNHGWVTGCVLIAGFCGFTHALQANAGIVPQWGHDHFLANPS
jgi:hypothetical protein